MILIYVSTILAILYQELEILIQFLLYILNDIKHTFTK